MLLLSFFLAVSARAAAVYADSPAQMTAHVREYFGSVSAEPAGLVSTLHALGGVDVADSRNQLALENLADETRSAAARLMDQAEQALRPGARPPTDDETARALERIHVLTRTPLIQFLGAHQLQQLQAHERRYTDLSSKEAATRVEERLARMAAALDERRPAPATPRPGVSLVAAAPSPAQVVADVRRFFDSPDADLAAFRPALAVLKAAKDSGRGDGLDLAAVQEIVRAGADKLASDLRAALEHGSDSATARSLTVRMQMIYFSPLGPYSTPAQRAALLPLFEKLVPKYPDAHEAGLRLWYDAMSALNGRAPAAAAPAEPAKAASPAASSRAARRAERELTRYRRRTRSRSARPAVEKPVTTPDWLRGPAPLSPEMKRAEELSAALAAAGDAQARAAAAAELAAFAAAQAGEDVQRSAARALGQALERTPEAPLADALASVAAATSFGRPQEIAVDALASGGFRRQLAALAKASALPHVKAFAAKRLEAMPNPEAERARELVQALGKTFEAAEFERLTGELVSLVERDGDDEDLAAFVARGFAAQSAYAPSLLDRVEALAQATRFDSVRKAAVVAFFAAAERAADPVEADVMIHKAVLLAKTFDEPRLRHEAAERAAEARAKRPGTELGLERMLDDARRP